MSGEPSELAALRVRVAELEAQLDREREDYTAERARLKRENYAALDGQQRRYQAELAMQKENYERLVAELRARAKAFEV